MKPFLLQDIGNSFLSGFDECYELFHVKLEAKVYSGPLIKLPKGWLLFYELLVLFPCTCTLGFNDYESSLTLCFSSIPLFEYLVFFTFFINCVIVAE
jgi:hypothetical protein